ncbi:capsule assembly Wzi family protein [Spirosoma rigui]|uniref:capsule assembly Wzi family protein n=1 Tax=Spirosoma rigui TaxID=564064 RepID=UPI0009B02632|nr:capsule assembly Wzi family protein [Spirosoma rigui]
MPDTLGLPRALPSRVNQTTADSSDKRSLQGWLELGGFASSSTSTPFWLQANQFGTIPETAPAGLMRLGVGLGYHPASAARRRKTDWGYGLELVGQTGQVNRLLIPEAYIKARLGVFEAFAGRRKQIVGLVESSLSSGSFIWSGNALPLPRVQIGIPTYTALRFTRNWIAIKGFFAHGWFGNLPYVSGSFLHQKAIFFRLGKEESRIRLYASFNHQAQWGGYAPFLESDPNSSFGGQFPTSLEAYAHVVIPMKSDALKNLSKFTTYDQNRVGDHRGAAEAAIEYQTKTWALLFYQQHFYDLGRKLYNGRNIEDGLYGLRFERKHQPTGIQEVIVELFNSGGQGYIQFGRTLGGEPENYFINGQYPDGWSYQGRTIGTPFITQASVSNAALPRIPFHGYTAANELITGDYAINNNRVWALYTGIRGQAGPRWGYQLKGSFSQNYGTFLAPFPGGTNQYSALASLSRRLMFLQGSTLLLSVGYDEGKLLASSRQYGGYLGLRKTWAGR